MRVLILGASGMVGSAIYRELKNDSQLKVYGTYNKNDTNEPALIKWNMTLACALDSVLMMTAPDVVISALTGDFERQLAAHRLVVEYLQKTGGRCVFISTANVFDGSPHKSFSESDRPYPMSAYGKFKLECENMLTHALGKNCLIVRLPKIVDDLYAKNLQQQTIYSNLFISLNTPQNVALALKECIKAGKSGILHLSSIDYMSVSEIAVLLGVALSENVQELTPQTYCKLLGYDDNEVIQFDGENFCLALSSTDEFSAKFSVHCKEILGL